MKPSRQQINELKTILDQVRCPGDLDRHPWARCLLVEEARSQDASLEQKSPGYRLVAVLSRLFRQMMPSTPPRRGKRLDTCWCQFGMLAAEYFAPFLYNTAYPSSMRDAWGRIDQSLPFFLFGNSGDDLPETELERYLLFADEKEPTPNSTLSDWHNKGVERLAEIFVSREQKLSQDWQRPSPVLQPEETARPAKPGEPAFFGLAEAGALPKKRRRSAGRWLLLLPFLILAGVAAWIGPRAQRVYQAGMRVRDDLKQVQGLVADKPNLTDLAQAVPLLSTTRQDLAALEAEARPYLWVGKWLGWVPVYGGDLEQAQPLLDFADGLVTAGDQAGQAVMPLLQVVQSPAQDLDLQEISTRVTAAQPGLSAARLALQGAIQARSSLDVTRLSPWFQHLIGDKVDPNLPLLQEGLALGSSLPRLIGAAPAGPQTYLILFQNEDELRATGGFLTAVGTVVVENGQILSFKVEDVYALDDLSKPYPPAPWQLQRYMQAHILLLRDSNWSPDFPTSAALAEYLYAYTRFHSADGVIAMDQHAIQILLMALGPVEVQGVSYPITSENVLAYMRSAKFDTGEQAYDPSQRKDFIGALGQAILARIQAGQGISLEAFSKALIQALDEKHILVQLDEPTAAKLLAQRGWDGAVRPGEGDFLMVIDSNIGFSKSNAVVEEALDYQVDLSDPTSPVSYLKVSETNGGSGEAPCTHSGLIVRSYQDSINLCYGDYLRVYGPLGMQLLEADPHAVPGDATLDGEEVPAHVDTLGEEVTGTQAFGTFFYVPVGATLDTDFQFLLPAGIVQSVAPQTYAYELHLLKQPGVQADSLHFCARLPEGSKVIDASQEGEMSENGWCLDGDLRTDLTIHLEFSVPTSWMPEPVVRSTATPYPSNTPGTPIAAATSTPGEPGFHGLDVPIGSEYQFVVHRVGRGESLALFAERCGTTVDAIQAVNYSITTPLAVGTMVVIPLDQVDAIGLPVFEAYQVHESISVENLARQLDIDPSAMATYNGLSRDDLFLYGEWALVPRQAGQAP